MITCDVDPNILRWGSEPERVNVENDAIIAHALQEEFSRVAAAESSGFTNPSQNSILAQNWLNDIVAIRVSTSLGKLYYLLGIERFSFKF